MGALWVRPKCLTVSVETQLCALSTDAWRPTVSFLVMVTLYLAGALLEWRCALETYARRRGRGRGRIRGLGDD